MWRRRGLELLTSPQRAWSRGRREALTSAAFAHVYIHPTAKVGQRCTIGPFTHIGEGVVVHDDVDIGSNVSLAHCTIHSHVVIHPGVRIGQDGFGFHLAGNGAHTKKPQELSVEIHEHVEIGANCAIDRGSWRNTVIGAGCKLDNLIQIGHNVQLGRGCVVAAQTGIAGSCTLGSNVHIGGQVGIAQHLTIGDNVRIAAKSGVMNSLDAHGTYGGTPAVPIMEYRRQMRAMQQQGRKTQNKDKLW
ncbi:TPA: hypothetical protein N0F65_008861 [Lagenidium giganteum]|uniref:Mannose-1-phosphate guanyltransferase C-terminal domain-containing protein n=1 Tax=Lagenidium giganteum TaxID=4803 RepID=A0AAV2YC75_9STRA|nr:TPA: hypothetical protein N0F65_008861 [Lagenidium giganteum]